MQLQRANVLLLGLFIGMGTGVAAHAGTSGDGQIVEPRFANIRVQKPWIMQQYRRKPTLPDLVPLGSIQQEAIRPRVPSNYYNWVNYRTGRNEVRADSSYYTRGYYRTQYNRHW